MTCAVKVQRSNQLSYLGNWEQVICEFESKTLDGE